MYDPKIKYIDWFGTIVEEPISSIIWRIKELEKQNTAIKEYIEELRTKIKVTSENFSEDDKKNGELKIKAFDKIQILLMRPL